METNKIKNYLLFGMSITIMILLLLLRSCDKETSNNKDDNSGYMKPDSLIYIKGDVDTIKIPDKQIVYKTIYLPKEIVKWKTLTSDSLISKEMNEYSDSVKSNEVITKYKAITLGKLISLDLSYKLINRSILKQVDTLKIIHTNIEFKPNKKILI